MTEPFEVVEVLRRVVMDWGDGSCEDLACTCSLGQARRMLAAVDPPERRDLYWEVWADRGRGWHSTAGTHREDWGPNLLKSQQAASPTHFHPLTGEPTMTPYRLMARVITYTEVPVPAKADKPPPCGATTFFWPDEENCEATCMLPRGHEPDGQHEDEALGTWSEDDLLTDSG